MSRYTTGEIAKLCGVSVRTIQYYDTREILVPSELSEGGRRLYSEQDLNKMKIICFLRGLEFSIDSIKSFFQEEHPEKVLSILLEEQEMALKSEIAEKQERVEKLFEVKKTLGQMSQLSVESIGDAAYIMQNKKQLSKLRRNMVMMALPINIIEITTIIIWVKTGMWLPFAVGMGIVAVIGMWVSHYYMDNVSYICPQCHGIFNPRFRDAFTAKHTPYTRKLTCTHCGYHGFSVETYRREEKKC